jgi:hypothetical protein
MRLPDTYLLEVIGRVSQGQHMSITIKAYYICVSVKRVCANTLPCVLSVSHNRLSFCPLSAQRVHARCPPLLSSLSLSLMSSTPYTLPAVDQGLRPRAMELGALPSVAAPLAEDLGGYSLCGSPRRRRAWQLPWW